MADLYDVTKSPYSESITNFISPEPLKYDRVKVQFSSDSTVMKAYIKAQYEAYDVALSTTGGKFSVSFEDFVSYCSTIVESRINWTMNNRLIVHPLSKIRVPAYLSITLASIGKVDIKEKGLVLEPSFSRVEGVKTLTIDEMTMISLKLSVLESRGFTFSEGYTKEKPGSMQVMSMQVAADYVLGQDIEAHPIHSVIAATFAVQGLATVLGEQSYRVKYADVNNLAMHVISFAEPKVVPNG